jgi:hypothetical protein
MPSGGVLPPVEQAQLGSDALPPMHKLTGVFDHWSLSA